MVKKREYIFPEVVSIPRMTRTVPGIYEVLYRESKIHIVEHEIKEKRKIPKKETVRLPDHRWP